MATRNIKGITVDIGGNTEPLAKALKGIDNQSRSLQRELKQVEKLLKLDPTNTELLAQKQKLLGEAIQVSKERLAALRNAQEQVNEQFRRGEIGEEQFRALQREIVAAENELKGFEGKLADVSNRAKTMGDQFASAGKKMTDIGKSMSTKVTAPIMAGVTLAVEGTKELRQDLARLEINAAQAGVSIDQANKSLRDLNGISSETDSNVEALSNLMAAGFKADGLQQAVDALSGAVIKFPDTLKIEGLADGLQETLATGKAIGPFAELLDRMGMDVEAFNKGLATTSKFGQEQQYVLNMLAKMGLADVAKAYREANKELIDNANAQHDLQQALAELGATLEPVITAIKSLLADLVSRFNALSPVAKNMVLVLGGVLAAIGPVLIVIGQMSTGIGAVIKVAGKMGPALTLVKNAMIAITGPIGIAIAAIAALIAIGVLVVKNWDTIKAAAEKVFKSIGDFIGGVVDKIKGFFTGLIDKGKEVIQRFRDIGKDIIEGLWDGIKSMGQWIGDKVSGFFGGIVSGIKRMLGISSPSKVFADQIGANMAAGIGEGFSKQMGAVSKAMGKEINGTVRDVAMPSQIVNLSSFRQARLGSDAPTAVASEAGTVNHYHVAAGAVVIPAKDLKEMRDVTEMFDRLPQAARARGAR